MSMIATMTVPTIPCGSKPFSIVFLVTRLVLVGLVDRVERAVAGEPDLDDDRDEEQRRQVLERFSHEATLQGR